MKPPEGPAQWACRYFDPDTHCCHHWDVSPDTYPGMCLECVQFEWRDPWMQYLSEKVRYLEERQKSTDVEISNIIDLLDTPNTLKYGLEPTAINCKRCRYLRTTEHSVSCMFDEDKGNEWDIQHISTCPRYKRKA